MLLQVRNPARLIGCFVAFAVAPAAAQIYPAKPVRFVAPYPAGGVNDIVARLLGQRMAAALGQQWVIDNRAGRGGIIGTDVVAKAAPDGYTLVHGGMGSLTLGPFLGKVLYDTLRDFALVTLTARAPNVLAVHPSLPARSVKELIALARSKPGELNYATSGVGSTPHLTAALFTSMARIRMVHVPYKGGPAATTDVLAGQVPIGFAPIPSFAPHVASGRLRGLAVTSLTRSALLPNVPTIAESGLGGFEMNPWFGVLAPAATPPEVIVKLNTELVRILRSPEIAQQFAAQGVEPAHSTAQDFVAVIRADLQKWGKVIQDAGIKGE
ncbi:MAG TPA: tripartite tricarboxylate transporter substrate binding protein [Burkholderiales bacterium]|nr:tripartite tricarboxylate transporter substrate binding protein [Burkholderiales bacterium]